MMRRVRSCAASTIDGGRPFATSLSGWFWLISRRYASLTSRSLASRATPSTA